MKNPPIDKVCHTIRDTIDIIVENCPEDAVLVESGTYLGNTAAFIVNNLIKNEKKFTLYTIDNFLYNNISNKQKSIDSSYKGYENYLENIRELEVENHIKTIISDSIEAINIFTDNSVYCLFIDDAHSYDHVKKQLDLWIPKMAKYGIIIGDDYESGVAKAFNEKFDSRVKSTGRGGCIIYDIS